MWNFFIWIGTFFTIVDKVYIFSSSNSLYLMLLFYSRWITLLLFVLCNLFNIILLSFLYWGISGNNVFYHKCWQSISSLLPNEHKIKEKYHRLYQSLAKLILVWIDIDTISIFKLMKFKCWSIIQVSNIIWKYKNITSVTATAVVLLLIHNSVNVVLLL